ncbi:MAG: hypothetical protein WBD22_07390 [Pyrinomonadaceae bacterium]
MNAKTRNLITLITIAVTLFLFPLEQSASAQSTKSNCKKLKGSSVQVFDPATGVVSGPVTRAGILNGQLEDVINFDAGFIFTPDPNVVTYISDLSITTIHGELKTSPVITQGVGFPYAFTEFGNIDPNTSNGRFAGATGLIFFTGKTVGDFNGPFEVEITGEICFANY